MGSRIGQAESSRAIEPHAAARGQHGTDLPRAVKISLDELRMQMLGAQVLFGFQFEALFQDAFARHDFTTGVVDAAGLGLMVTTIGLLIAVPSQHRLVERGEATERVYAASMHYAERALLPLAASIGCDVFVAAGHSFGAILALPLAVLSFILAIAAWFALGSVLRRKWATDRIEVPMASSPTPLQAKIEQMLTEARVILPGAQALLGFHFIVMLTRSFDELPPAVRGVHVIALICLVLAIILLISPAAVHRITFRGDDDPRMHSAGSTLITIALVPLLCAITCDIWVALVQLFGQGTIAFAGALAVLMLLTGLWYVMPLLLRRS